MSTLIDIGCNQLGGYGKLVDILGITSAWHKIFIEPNPEIHNYLQDEINKIPNSTFLPCALTATGQPVRLVTRSDVHGDIAATTLGRPFLDDTLKKFDQHAPGYKYYDVLATTLEKVLQRTSSNELYIKMDCEGDEHAILRSFPWEQIHRVKKLFVEFHGDLPTEGIRKQFLQHGIEIMDWE
jgi:FkbM family methyltransferase